MQETQLCQKSKSPKKPATNKALEGPKVLAGKVSASWKLSTTERAQ